MLGFPGRSNMPVLCRTSSVAVVARYSGSRSSPQRSARGPARSGGRGGRGGRGRGGASYQGSNLDGGHRGFESERRGGGSRRSSRSSARGGRLGGGNRMMERQQRHRDDDDYDADDSRYYYNGGGIDDDGARGDWDDDIEDASDSEDGEEWRAPTIHDRIIGDGVLYGVFPVLNALKAQRRALHALYVLGTLDLSKRKDASAMRDVFRLAKQQGLPVHKEPRHNLNVLSNYKQHQGLVLDCSSLQWSKMDTLPPASDINAASPTSPPPVWLALDEVMDPGNFGALVRSAHCLGAAGILVCSKNCAPLSAAVSKASAGVLEVAEVHACHNMVKTLQAAVSDGWQVLGAIAEQRAQTSRDVRVTQPTVIVMGNEGSGLRTNVKRACSGYVMVEMGAPTALLAADSLNVSVAAGILMHALVGSAAAEATALPPIDQPID